MIYFCCILTLFVTGTPITCDLLLCVTLKTVLRKKCNNIYGFSSSLLINHFTENFKLKLCSFLFTPLDSDVTPAIFNSANLSLNLSLYSTLDVSGPIPPSPLPQRYLRQEQTGELPKVADYRGCILLIKFEIKYVVVLNIENYKYIPGKVGLYFICVKSKINVI